MKVSYNISKLFSFVIAFVIHDLDKGSIYRVYKILI